MTEDKRKQPNPEDRNAAYIDQSVDQHLQCLVSIVNNLSHQDIDIKVGITLFVEGTIISGFLISRRKYFETFAQQFASAIPIDAENKENIRQFYTDISDQKDEECDLLPPQFIHLSMTFFSLGEHPMNNRDGVLWRGRINAVSGFSMQPLSLVKV